MYKAKINVTLKKSVFDPQGKAVLDALHSMGFKDADNLRVGKFFDLSLEAKTRKQAETEVKEMCEKLFTNPVIEQYAFELEEVKK